MPRSPKELPLRKRLQRQCDYCDETFSPHPRLGTRQKTCGKALCKLACRAAYKRQYRKDNHQLVQDIEKKRRVSRPLDFWKQYRKKNPGYEKRNRAQSLLRKQLRRVGLQRQLDIVQLIDPPSKLDSLVGFATSHRLLLEACSLKSAA